ncbi:MAG: ASCH domain-containing protein [Blastocatellia bacterium]|nr:ASCH domain-containing protein [Blastocatellia bacterium]
MRALSIRQPYAEMIMKGKKKIEYRSRSTKIRERVYIYASLTPGYEEAWADMKMSPGDLPTGVLIGTVEIVNCTGKKDKYEWHLAKPIRAKRMIKPKRQPQPAWFYPFSSPND